MIKAKIAFRALETFFDGPAQTCDAGQVGERRLSWSKNEIIGAIGRLASAASDQEPMRKARVLPPMQPHTRPIV